MRQTVVRRCLLVLLVLVLPACGDPVVPRSGPASQASVTATPTATVDVPVDGCPANVPADQPLWVPAPPTTETDGRLVPDADPVTALVCRYRDPQDGEPTLAAEAALSAGLDGVRHDLLVPRRLERAERSCTAMGGPVVPHLVRLSYADGDLWLAARVDPNGCVDSGNGEFVTSAYLGRQVSASFDAGRWVPDAPRPDRGCFGSGRGRAGQEDQLVPAGWTSAVLCRPSATAAPPVPRALDRGTTERVVALLGQVPSAPGTGGCSGPSRTTYDLLVDYPQGPSVQVRFAPGCEPPMRNGSLDATPTAAQSAQLEDLLRAP